MMNLFADIHGVTLDALTAMVAAGELPAWLDLNKRLDQRYANRAVVATT